MGEEPGFMFMVNRTIGSVLCCRCGIRMAPNAANMCVKCLSSEVDITQGLQKRVIINHCPVCDRYLKVPDIWVKAPLESRELLQFCVKRLKNMNKVRLVGAEFIWTEPHSKRIKLRLTVQKEVLNGAVLEQSYVVEFVQVEHMCRSCSRIQANPDQWVATVQLRQRVPHKRTLFCLEQLILRHGAANSVIEIRQKGGGMDFLFANRSHALKFMEFVGKVAPIKHDHKENVERVSHDTKNNSSTNKYVFPVEISPICREDLIYLPPSVALRLGNLGPLVICTKVTNNIALLDPRTLRQCVLNTNQSWSSLLEPLLSSRRLVKYVILDVEKVRSEDHSSGSRYALAGARVVRVSDSEKTTFSTRTHLGHLLNPGDHALGYDLYGANINNIELDKYKGRGLQEVILIKKCYEEKRQTKRENAEKDEMNSEYEQFLKDLEEDPDSRFNISLYRNRGCQSPEMAPITDGEDVPSIPLEEMLDDLDLSEDEDGDSNMRD